MADDRYGAAVRLADALRALNQAALTSGVRAAEFDAVAEIARPLADRLSAEIGAIPPSSEETLLGRKPYGAAAGEANPLAPPLRYESDDGDPVGRVTLGPGHEGHIGYAHGGVISMLLDDALGLAAQRRIAPVVTTQLDIRYRRPVPTGEPLVVRAWVAKTNGRHLNTRGTISAQADPDTVLAEGEGSFIALDRRQTRAMLGIDLDEVRQVSIAGEA